MLNHTIPLLYTPDCLKYFLESAIYKNDTERETFLLVELAIEIAQKISDNCENIELLIDKY